MNNRQKRELGDDAAALVAASPEHVAIVMHRLEAARTQLAEAHVVIGQPLGRPLLGMHTRRTIDYVDAILQALHDAGGRS